MKLTELKPNEKALITRIHNAPVKMLEMGILEGIRVQMIRHSPLQKMILLRANGNLIALPQQVAQRVVVRPMNEDESLYCEKVLSEYEEI